MGDFQFDPRIVATGSSGNFAVLNDVIALDMGVPYKMVRPFAKKLKLVFAGHQHSDHIKPSTIASLAMDRPALRFAVGPFLVDRLLDCGVSKKNIDVIEPGNVYDYGMFKISPVSLHHNVENYGLKIYMGGKKAIYMVDTGFVDDIVAKDFDLYMLENNHTEDDIKNRIERKLDNGQFAYEMQAQYNHLSEEKAIEWLAQNAGPNSKYVWLHGHVDKEEKQNA